MVVSISPDADGSMLPFARQVLRREADALHSLADGLDGAFERALRTLLGIPGRVAVTGMGKSGHVARKVAATLASTGTPAYFVHPAEASHGDLGMVSRDDALLAFSNSGETGELSDVLLYASRLGLPVVGVTRRRQSFLGRHAACVLLLPDVPEADPTGCAPTTSTTLQMALGDALALALMRERGGTVEDFHRFHPGGQLGRKLMLVREIMHVGDALPLVTPDTLMSDVLCVMSGKGFGTAGVVDAGRVAGIITDGDLRRHMGDGLPSLKAAEVMSPDPATVTEDTLAAAALALMQARRVTCLLVVRGESPVGILNVHDCLRAGLR